MEGKKIFLSIISLIFQILMPVAVFGLAIQSVAFNPELYHKVLDENKIYLTVEQQIPDEYKGYISTDFLENETHELVDSSLAYLTGDEDNFTYELPTEEVVDQVVDNIPECDQFATITIENGIPNCIPPFMDREEIKEDSKALLGNETSLEPFEQSLSEAREYVMLFNNTIYGVIGVLIFLVVLFAILLKSPLDISKWLGGNLLLGGIFLGISAYLMPQMTTSVFSGAAYPEVVINITKTIITRISNEVVFYSAIIVMAGAVIKFGTPLLLGQSNVKKHRTGKF